MSDFTIKIPIAKGETLIIDGEGNEIFGYRVVSEDSASPQTVVGGLMEALQFIYAGSLDGLELMEKLSEVSASVCDEMKLRSMGLVESPWRRDRLPAKEDANNSPHVLAQTVWVWSDFFGPMPRCYHGITHDQWWAPHAIKPMTKPKD